MAKWPKGLEPDPERYTVDMIVEKFWEFRPKGRKWQSLREDAALYCKGWIGPAGRENAGEAFRRIMEKEEEDVAAGGKVHDGDEIMRWLLGKWKPKPRKGLKIYG